MPIPKPFVYARLSFGLILLIGLIWYFDAESIIRPFADLQLIWVLGATLLILAATLIGAFNRHLLINLEGKFPFFTFLPMYWVAWAMGLIIPGQVGEVAALSTMLRQKGMLWPESLGRSLLDKLISFSTIFLLGVGGVLLVTASGTQDQTVIVVLAAIGAVVALTAALMLRRRELVTKYFSYETGVIAGTIGDTAREFLTTCICHPGKITLNALLTFVGIGIIGTAYWCMFVALGYTDVPQGKLILLVAACSIVAYIPISFNGIGTVEVTGIVLFGLLGIPATAVLSAYLCLRLIVMALAWLPAIVILVIRAPAIPSKTS